MTDLPPYPEGSEPPAGYPPLPSYPPAQEYPPAYPPPGYGVPPGYAPPGAYPPPYPAPGVPTQGMPPGMVPPQYPYPTYGYQVPGGQPLYDMYGQPVDPLVTPPGEGFAGWWSRLWKVFARSWGALALIIGVTSGLPAIVLGIYAAQSTTLTDLQHALQQKQDDPNSAFVFPHGLAQFVGVGIVLGVLAAVCRAVGWAASIWTLTRQAAGEPAPFGTAILYGLKNFPRVFGWVFVYSLLIGVGTVCCILPGLYFAIAGSLIVPLVIFSRGSVSESFRLVNKNFGAVLGRILAVYGLGLAVGVVSLILSSVLGAAGGTPGRIVSEVLSSVLGIPGTIILIIGVTLTYAEMRAKEMITTTPMMNQAL